MDKDKIYENIQLLMINRSKYTQHDLVLSRNTIQIGSYDMNVAITLTGVVHTSSNPEIVIGISPCRINVPISDISPVEIQRIIDALKMDTIKLINDVHDKLQMRADEISKIGIDNDE